MVISGPPFMVVPIAVDWGSDAVLHVNPLSVRGMVRLAGVVYSMSNQEERSSRCYPGCLPRFSLSFEPLVKHSYS